MNCMKCGRETPREQVFCEDCLLEMEKYPVKPGTVVFLPRNRVNTPPKKASKRRVLSLEDQVKLLKKRVRILAVLVILLLGAVIAMAYPTFQHLMESQTKIGQNYNTVVASTAPTDTTEVLE